MKQLPEQSPVNQSDSCQQANDTNDPNRGGQVLGEVIGPERKYDKRHGKQCEETGEAIKEDRADSDA